MMLREWTDHDHCKCLLLLYSFLMCVSAAAFAALQKALRTAISGVIPKAVMYALDPARSVPTGAWPTVAASPITYTTGVKWKMTSLEWNCCPLRATWTSAFPALAPMVKLHSIAVELMKIATAGTAALVFPNRQRRSVLLTKC